MRTSRNLSSCVAICVFFTVLAGPAAGRTLKVDRNGPPYKLDSAYFSSIQLAIDHAGNGDEIAVWPGTYYEAIDFKGKAVRLYSTGGPKVTIIDARPTITDSFEDGNYHGWQIVNEGNSGYGSDWRVVVNDSWNRLGQFSNLHLEPMEAKASRGTYALWKESFHWDDYRVNLLMKSQDNDKIGVMFRYQDHDNYYRFSWDRERSQMWLGKMVNGQFTILASKSKAYAAYKWYPVEIGVHDSLLAVIIDGAYEFTLYDPSLGYGPIALYCWGNDKTYFDDVTVSRITTQYHAVQCVNGEGPATVLEGFTITGGNASGVGPDNRGGGMYNYQSSPTVIDCNFTGNTAGYGGGMYNYESSPMVTNCIFGDNFTTRDGAGMFNEDSNPTVTDCTFINNDANENGGGMLNNASSPAISNCTFTDNTADYGGGMLNDDHSHADVVNCTFSGNDATNDGGGMYNLGGSNSTVTKCTFIGNEGGRFGGGMCNSNCNPTVSDCSFSQNTAKANGGGIWSGLGSPTVINCSFRGNTATGKGGGMFNDGGKPTVANCTFSHNTAGDYGGAMRNWSSSPKLTNCTFTKNSANNGGGGMYNGGNSNPNVTNCILWDDAPDEILDDGSTTTVTHSDVQGGTGQSWFGTDCIDADPCFVDAAAGDFRIATATSPCVDAGDNGAPNLPGTDFDGNPRVINGNWDSAAVVDMGAYEHLGPTTLLTVDIAPQGAADAGAAWRLAGETQWRDGGDAVYDLAPESHNVEFKEAPGWAEPETLAVRVLAATPTRPAAEYKRIPRFDIGQIPPRDAPHGRRLAFYVYSEDLGPTATLSALVDQLPEGPVYFDPDSGLFTYDPNDTDDRTPFFVAFTAEIGGTDPCSQVVEISPVPDLPPESSIVSRVTQPFPDPCSSDYLFVNEIDLQDPGDPDTFIWFNTEKRATRSITIAGKTVAFESGHENGLYDVYNNPESGPPVDDIKEMTIHAETVIICDPLHLPQTDVTIYARDLVFKGDGAIATTPLGDWLPVHIDGQYLGEDPPVDGNDGHTAGDISLYIGAFATQAGSPRFILNGGRGQDPEPGRKGNNGTNVALATGWPQAPGRPSGLTSIEAYHKEGGSERGPYYSPDPHPDIGVLTPRAGTDAAPAGKPGNGGPGGDLIATFDLSAYAESLGGQSGQVGNGGIAYTGGQNGTPNPAYKAVMVHVVIGGLGGDDEHWWLWHPTYHDIYTWRQGRTTLLYWAAPALNGRVPATDVPVGPAGKTLHRPRAFVWLTPYALKMVVAHAKDAYLYGYAAEAQDILQEYYELLEIYMGLAEWSELSEKWRLEFEQMHDEIGTLLHRLASGLDYFGNPPDWVPMLSFEVLKTVYEQEIDHAIRVLYLSYWLQKKADDLTQTQNALREGREKLWYQTQRFRSDYETVAEIIGPLKTEAAKIAAKIGRADPGGCYGLLCQLKAKEAELVKRADEDVAAGYELPTWKKTLRLCGAIVGSVGTGGSRGAAGGAPGIVAGIGGGVLDAAMDEFLADPDPWLQINMRNDVVKQFNSIEFDEATAGWLENFDDIENLSQIEEQGVEDCLATMRNDANQMADGLYDIKEALMTTSLSNEEVEARLKEIKAENPEFNRFVDDITKLMVRKEVFNRRLAAAMQKVSTLSRGITNNLLAIDAMNRDASDLNRILDPRALMYIKDMEQRALERLLKYHYYMAKAYEYRILEPYPEDLNIQEIFNTIVDIADAPTDPCTMNGSLGPGDFDALKVVYEEQLRDLAENIIDRFMEGSYGYQQTTSYRLSPREIGQLNSTNQVTIDFVGKGLIPSSRENIRIVNLTASRLEASIVGPSPVSFGQLIVKTQHSGLSRIQDANQIFLFRHINPNSPKHEMLDISWLCEWDIISDEIQQREISDASKSLLAAVVGDDVYEDGYVLLSRPSAWADMTISKEVNADTDCTIDIEPNGLTFQVQYDYYDKDPLLGLKTLVISTEPNGPDWGVMPYFVVDRPDQSNRQDGIGSFRRMYECWNPQPVGITAPETHGCWRFDRWTDKFGSTMGTNPHLSIALNCDGPDERSIRARYNYEGPPLSPADFDESAYVDFSDFGALTRKWHTISADPQWDPNYDISETADGVIDMRDVAAFAENWLVVPR